MTALAAEVVATSTLLTALLQAIRLTYSSELATVVEED